MEATRRKIQTISIYERVMTIVWQRLAPTFGIRTINAIAKNVIVRQAAEHPFAQFLKVGEDGLVWDDVKSHAAEMNEADLHHSLDAIVDEFFDALSNLIGRLIVGKLFQEVEELVRKGGTE